MKKWINLNARKYNHRIDLLAAALHDQLIINLIIENILAARYREGVSMTCTDIGIYMKECNRVLKSLS